MDMLPILATFYLCLLVLVFSLEISHPMPAWLTYGEHSPLAHPGDAIATNATNGNEIP